MFMSVRGVAEEVAAALDNNRKEDLVINRLINLKHIINKNTTIKVMDKSIPQKPTIMITIIATIVMAHNLTKSPTTNTITIPINSHPNLKTTLQCHQEAQIGVVASAVAPFKSLIWRQCSLTTTRSPIRRHRILDMQTINIKHQTAVNTKRTTTKTKQTPRLLTPTIKTGGIMTKTSNNPILDTRSKGPRQRQVTFQKVKKIIIKEEDEKTIKTLIKEAGTAKAIKITKERTNP